MIRERHAATRRSHRPPTHPRRWLPLVAAVAALLAPGAALSAAPNVLVRYPTLSGHTIVFEAAGNLWRVDRRGGTAVRLTADPGDDLMPRFSPDGKWIAFTGQYDGNTDVYVIPAAGGPARRLTFHSDVIEQAPLRWGPDNMVVSWTPDGKDILFLSRRTTPNDWFGQLFLVSPEGGPARPFPLPKGGMTSFRADGKKIAYNRIFRNFRTWKRYTGGLAQDIWTYDLTSHESERITRWKGTDTDPMWSGDTIYFASDRGPHFRLNLWAYDTKTGESRQVTHFTDDDIDWPSLGDSGIVFQCGGELYVLDLPAETLHTVDVSVPVDGLRTRPRQVDAAKHIQSFDVAPNGKRALFGARGDLFTVPAEHGDTRDLTKTAGTREEWPAWSPDGKWVAYVTDASGEAQLAIRPSGGPGEETVLTRRDRGYLYPPTWAPDSGKLAVADSEHTLWVVDVAKKTATRVDQDPIDEIHDYAFSPDARWLAYDKRGENRMRDIYLYEIAAGETHRVTSSDNDDYEPVFGAEGKELFFISRRHENTVFNESELNVATVKSAGIYVATLEAGAPSPFAPRSDEGTPDDTSKADESKAAPWKPGAIAPIAVDLDGLASRAVPLPIPAGDITGLATARGHVYYMTEPLESFGEDLPGEEPALHVFDMDKRADSVLVSPLDAYALSADGSTVLYHEEESYTLTSALPDGGDDPAAEEGEGDEALDLSGMTTFADPVAEWREMFGQAWRLERDLFYNREMNGVDWPAVRAHYEKLLPLAATRQDLDYLIGQMIGELGNSHTYVGGGDPHQKIEPVPTGLLGVDFRLDEASGRYALARIYPGDNTREAFRSPLTEPGLGVHEGDFLLAVDGRELRAPTNPYSLFVGTVGRTVRLTVASSADGKDRHDLVVEPLASELALRKKAWIEHNRQAVDEASGGKLGYLYLSDMGEDGMQEFLRQYYPQVRKQGLVVDVRYNGGGFIDQILLERLRRVLVGMATNRLGARLPIPGEAVHGPMACLINHYSASDGDIFPDYFRRYGLGPLIGTRTWGGVRGIRGPWPLLDGGYITIPEESLYGLGSQWVIENHGVDPDIEVDDLPGDVMAGKDAQLDRAVAYLMEKIREHPEGLPAPPPALPPYPPAHH